VDFHSANLTSRSANVLEPDGVVLPDSRLRTRGSVKGRITMKYGGLKFRADTKVQHSPCRGHARDRPHRFPIDSLHWDFHDLCDTVETCTTISATSIFRPHALGTRTRRNHARHIPVTSEAVLRYRYTPNSLELSQFDFDTPSLAAASRAFFIRKTLLWMSTWISVAGVVGRFIHAISGDKPGTPAAKYYRWCRCSGMAESSVPLTAPRPGPLPRRGTRATTIRSRFS